jgi:hypothetical protein
MDPKGEPLTGRQGCPALKVKVDQALLRRVLSQYFSGCLTRFAGVFREGDRKMAYHADVSHRFGYPLLP